jgi:DNA-binding XRE family transcriptional regulator
MQAHTRKHPTDAGLVPLHFMVHPVNVERIKKFVETVEPVDEEGSISLDEFFVKYFPGETETAVCLRGSRTREGITQKQLSDLTGIPQRHISEIETGKRTIGKETARKLATALNVDYRVFL